MAMRIDGFLDGLQNNPPPKTILLQVENTLYKACIAQLTQQSEVFKPMLEGHYREKDAKVIALEDDGEAFEIFLKCLKKEQATNLITDTNVTPLLWLADKYLVKWLKKVCEDKISHNVLFDERRYISYKAYQILQTGTLVPDSNFVENSLVNIPEWSKHLSNSEILEVKSFASQQELHNLYSFCEYLLLSENRKIRACIILCEKGLVTFKIPLSLLKNFKADFEQIFAFKPTYTTGIALEIGGREVQHKLTHEEMKEKLQIINVETFTKNITTLNLTHSFVFNENPCMPELQSLIDACPRLQILNLSDTFNATINSAGLPNLNHLTELCSIDLSLNSIGDDLISSNSRLCAWTKCNRCARTHTRYPGLGRPFRAPAPWAMVFRPF